MELVKKEVDSIFCRAIYNHLFNCEHCQSVVMSILAARAGRTVTAAKRRASRANGKLGGRPRKETLDKKE